VTAAGTLYGLGLGPGDPELITLKALRLLRAAPVVAYPAPTGGASFARSIVAEFLCRGQLELRVDVPMNPDPQYALEAYAVGAAAIAEHLAAGRDVALLCQGDPFFYGSFMYLFGLLAKHFTIEVVPGVSSVMAAAAATGVPLVCRDDVMTVVPATLSAAELEKRLEAASGIAILKLGRHFSKVREVLGRLGLLERARYVERVSLPQQRMLSVSAVDPASVPYFSMILVHRRQDPWTSEET
jgi:precorrin-2/cobalt-factor-2 C20-methyltransferase